MNEIYKFIEKNLKIQKNQKEKKLKKIVTAVATASNQQLSGIRNGQKSHRDSIISNDKGR